MEQYISKSALLTEIERRLDELYNLLPNASKVENGTITTSESCNTGKYTALESFKDYVDTLEVKEVDLEKEIDKFYGMYRKNGITFSIEDNQECLDWKVDCNPNFVKAFAKHFFELGMQQSKNHNNNEE